MKVAHVISTIGPGGAEIFVKSLAAALADEGTEQEIWSLSTTERIYRHDEAAHRFESAFNRDLLQLGVAVRCLGIRDRPNLVEGTMRFHQMMGLHRPDIVHIHIYWGLLYGFLYQRKVPFIFTHHGGRLRLVGLHKRQFGKVLRKYIAVCGSDHRMIKRDVGLSDDKVDLVFNGIDIARFENPERSRHAALPLRVIAVGRFFEQKNYSMMVRAFRLVVDGASKLGLPIPILSIVGDGPLRQAIQGMVDDFGLLRYVRLLGIRTDVPRLLQESDLFLMSSAWEGMPIVLLEALASGIPIVATDVDGNKDVLAESGAGYLVTLNDDEMMADTVLRIAQDIGLWGSLSRSAKERAQLFSIENSTRKHLEIYSAANATLS